MLSVAPGQLKDRFQREVQSIIRERIVERLWAKDVSLWPESRLTTIVHSRPSVA